MSQHRRLNWNKLTLPKERSQRKRENRALDRPTRLLFTNEITKMPIKRLWRSEKSVCARSGNVQHLEEREGEQERVRSGIDARRGERAASNCSASGLATGLQYFPWRANFFSRCFVNPHRVHMICKRRRVVLFSTLYLEFYLFCLLE